MRLLITTQAVDRDDPILGFFCNWLREFSGHFESIHVICLREGVHILPDNVFVHSLGKERGESRVKYVLRFLRYAWLLHREYDVIFSHMNPHYIVLMGWFWTLLGKRMYFWRNHAKMNLMTRIAAFFARRVFYTSPFACTRVFPHAVQMPVGIDTGLFKQDTSIERKEHSVLLLGRLSPVKHPELFMKASGLLPEFELHSYGDAAGGGATYQATLEKIAGGRVAFHGAVPNYETPAIYNTFDMYVNLTPEGSMDKTVLEAAACGALPIVANRSFESFLPGECIVKNSEPTTIAEAIRLVGNLPREKKEIYRKQLIRMVEQEHSLKALTAKLVPLITNQA